MNYRYNCCPQGTKILVGRKENDIQHVYWETLNQNAWALKKEGPFTTSEEKNNKLFKFVLQEVILNH